MSKEAELKSKYGPLIGVDIDGVLYQWSEAARDAIMTLRGVDVPAPPDGEDQYWDHSKDLMSKDDWHFLWNNKDARRRMFACGRAYPDGVRAVRKLEKVSRVVLMTHRPPDVMDVTMRWLAGQKIRPHALVHVAAGDKKWEHELKCATFVDDRADNVRAIVKEQGITCHMPRRGWNSELHHANGPIRPFDDWDEVIKWVEEELL